MASKNLSGSSRLDGADGKELLEAMLNVTHDWEQALRAASSYSATFGVTSTKAPNYTHTYSALPELKTSLHSHHGYPSSMLRRLAQEFTQHVSNHLSDELAQFINDQTNRNAQIRHATNHTELEDNKEALPSSSSSSSAATQTLDQYLDGTPMYTLLKIMDHVLLFTNNRYILHQQSV